MTGYECKISEASLELSKKERIMYKDTSNAVAIDAALEEGDSSLILTPKGYVILDIENPLSKNQKQYRKFVIIGEDGNKYMTGSESFFSSFLDIWKEMDGEEFTLEVFRKPSKNYSGKYFISCSIVG